MIRTFLLLFVSLSILTISACQRAEQKSAASSEAKRYPLTGKVVSVDQANKKAKIDHEEIKGYMPAMKMDFPIKQEWVLREVKPGNKISGDMVVESNGEYFLENVAISASPLDNVDSGEPLKEAPTDKVGKEIVNFRLKNQDGKAITAADFRGRILVLTFIFTTCPDPEFCPLMSLNMSDLEKMIRQNAELKDRVRLLSISFDPQKDTPEVLRKYGVGYLGNPEKPSFDIWQLATGSQQEVEEVTNFFNLKTIKEGERLAHNLRTALVAPNGKIVKLYPGNDWRPADVFKEIQNLNSNAKNL
ncbi:MAG: SCO family protein [Acidobacteriota bacterium]|nr:SCO family protein [Acidobacteriota bacterium]